MHIQVQDQCAVVHRCLPYTDDDHDEVTWRKVVTGDYFVEMSGGFV
jgi:hypothetical protein